MKYDFPQTKKEFDRAFFQKDKKKHIVIDGMEMTAENIWNHPDRTALLEKCVDYFYRTGFVKEDMPDDRIVADIRKVFEKDVSEAVTPEGELKNTSTAGLETCRHFCWDQFYGTSANGTSSISAVFKDRKLLGDILKNRMGWYTTTETLTVDGVRYPGEHPYLFDISQDMVVQGAHSSMKSANISNFRPLVAKYLIDRYCMGENVMDLSIGWGARYLAAAALKKNYYGIDPMTAKPISNLAGFLRRSVPELKTDCMFVENGSEYAEAYSDFPEMDYVIVCPPYFSLEEYSSAKNSTTVYPEYGKWLRGYWNETVRNAVAKMKRGAKFTLIMVDVWQKFRLAEDMAGILSENSLEHVETLPYRTNRSHLTNKRKSGVSSKNTEKAYTFRKL